MRTNGEEHPIPCNHDRITPETYNTFPLVQTCPDCGALVTASGENCSDCFGTGLTVGYDDFDNLSQVPCSCDLGKSTSAQPTRQTEGSK